MNVESYNPPNLASAFMTVLVQLHYTTQCSWPRRGRSALMPSLWPSHHNTYSTIRAGPDELRCVWVTSRPQRPSLVRERAMPEAVLALQLEDDGLLVLSCFC